ncbi:MAG: DUF1501 domain-containing protein [Xanthomonadales bacterium]|nr:DUF1501 domain-containing protein [Xanthomonadales bacterium]ODU93120.1 MAG: hypothetical protein ABT18_10030 [Rhodanobacter sp. SCN 66-43]OJY84178.1 MAG: hypothetical protein BGP23_13980 [Xanthomonadales bacterium 66-474]
MVLTRRQFLANSMLGAATLLIWPKLTFAATGSDTRFLFVLLRGGLDGLESVPPYGDPGYQAIRGALALSPSADKPAHKLDNVFALHPSFDHAAQLYAQGQFMPVVAAAPPYWGRSHFQAQDCVENGTAKPDGAQTGWLNRCIACMPGVDGLACAAVMPLTMRGNARVETWSPPLPNEVNPILLQRLQPLYAADARLAAPFARAVVQQSGASVPETETGLAAMQKGMPGRKRQGGLPVMMGAAGKFMGEADGPRVAFVEDDGWDTHANEAAIVTRKIAELDAGLKAFHDSIGARWDHTVVIVATEFGRTAHINGTGGTDHGTGGSMFLAGGALRGGRVAGKWPGIGSGELYQDRDVHATTDFRSVFKGVLAVHLGVPVSLLESRVFPGSAAAEPLDGLVAATRSVA